MFRSLSPQRSREVSIDFDTKLDFNVVLTVHFHILTTVLLYNSGYLNSFFFLRRIHFLILLKCGYLFILLSL